MQDGIYIKSNMKYKCTEVKGGYSFIAKGRIRTGHIGQMFCVPLMTKETKDPYGSSMAVIEGAFFEDDKLFEKGFAFAHVIPKPKAESTKQSEVHTGQVDSQKAL